MKKEVEITISGLHTGEESTGVETSICGEYFRREDKHYLFFEENMEEGISAGAENAKVKTRVTFSDKRLELTRRGSVTTYMIFEEGKIHSVDYATPYGSFPMEIDTKAVCVKNTADGFHIMAKYTIFMDGQPFSDSKIEISVREK